MLPSNYSLLLGNKNEYIPNLRQFFQDRKKERTKYS